MVQNLEELEKRTFEENDSPELPPPDIIAYNELRSCADLVRMHEQGILEIQPIFEREIVWKPSDQTRFIDSLIKQLPIPSMCFSLDFRAQKWQVIDGLQRMATIIKFLSDEQWNLSKLDDINPKIAGQPISDFRNKKSVLNKYLIRVENLTLPITVIRCDYKKKNHTNYLFTIFHRLNTGGMKLNNQEIRNCIYSGSFNYLLKELDKDSKWMEINRMEKSKGYRFTKQELTLRFFAFHDKYSTYKGRLSKFLNEYMAEKIDPGEKFLNEKRCLFHRTVDIIYSKLFEGKMPAKLSITVLESVLVGISFNLRFIESITNRHVQKMYKKLLKHEEFSDTRLSEGLSSRARVLGRISAARKIFSGS